MKIGFTGTRVGMTDEQKRSVKELLGQFSHDFVLDQVHHGDCVGADADFHDIARNAGLYIVGHPPIDQRLRAFCECDECRPPKPYLIRDNNIVRETHMLIACPKGNGNTGGGTWYTIGQAEKLLRPVVLVLPNGDYYER